MEPKDLGDSPYAQAMDSIDAMRPMLETLSAVKTEIELRGFTNENAETCAVEWWKMVMRILDVETGDKNEEA